jgi:hypothetical protein
MTTGMSVTQAFLRGMILAAFAVVLLWVGFAWRTAESPAPEALTPPRPALPAGDRTRRPRERRGVDAAASDAATPPEAGQPAPVPPPASSPQAPQATPGLAVDSSRNFYPDANTVALFESRLSASQPVEQSIAALRAEIQSKLEPVAEEQALEFLDRYLSYRQRGIELGLNQDVQEDFRPRFAQLRSLRREFFGMDVGQRVFGDEEREANIALREHEILSDPDLSDEERRVLLDELYNPPPEQRE